MNSRQGTYSGERYEDRGVSVGHSREGHSRRLRFFELRQDYGRRIQFTVSVGIGNRLFQCTVTTLP
jgi:hypothetical protein